jgi:hypothetical protein
MPQRERKTLIDPITATVDMWVVVLISSEEGRRGRFRRSPESGI